jgi:hypothetical protein
MANSYPNSLRDLKEICLSTLDARAVGLVGAARIAWNGRDSVNKKGENQHA